MIGGGDKIFTGAPNIRKVLFTLIKFSIQIPMPVCVSNTFVSVVTLLFRSKYHVVLSKHCHFSHSLSLDVNDAEGYCKIQQMESRDG